MPGVEFRIIVNRKSSATDRLVNTLPARLARIGIHEPIVTVDDHVMLERHVRRWAKRGIDAVLVGGGDGSMTLAANALAKKRTILGVLPLGTGNSFASTLGIGADLDRAIDVIGDGRHCPVDLGRVNGRYFANFATVGLPAEIAENTPHALKPIAGPASYAIAGIKPFLGAHGFRAKVRWPGGTLRINTVQMVIASGRYFGKVPLLPDASAVDGKLAFFTTTGVSHLEIARSYVAVALGLQANLPDAQSFSATKVRVRTRGPQPISIDGDPGGTTPATFRVAKGALRVFVPEDFTGKP
jgi:YegS/Rv2252/BmrU family lipid kinase